MNATKTKTTRRGPAAGKTRHGIRGVEIRARGEDGKTFRMKVPAPTLAKALGWGAAVLIGIEVVKAGVEKIAHRKSKSSSHRAAPRRAASRRS